MALKVILGTDAAERLAGAVAGTEAEVPPALRRTEPDAVLVMDDLPADTAARPVPANLRGGAASARARGEGTRRAYGARTLARTPPRLPVSYRRAITA